MIRLIRRVSTKKLKDLTHNGPAIISCKNSELNHYTRAKYGKFEEVPWLPKAGITESPELTLSSATLPQNLDELLSGIIAPESITSCTYRKFAQDSTTCTAEIHAYVTNGKPTELLRLVKFDYQKKYPVIIFSNKTETCDWVSMFLNENGLPCVNLNGDMPYVFRLNTFEKFRRANRLYSSMWKNRRTGSPEACHVTNFISKPREIELVQRIETSVRRKNTLPNVNGNITVL
ncbi:probable ATP-dependent RNA helicase DDX28 [Ctenocephalides felis]|uniref:probable ATP-dependent RNA helicase DDX28 n=1 Tax=Ctenocephalides felis TaxID=7515 RepID=UPI000E6E571D|nr:probable ATP-dependent RNA helicase DDX28 [Ctenocephalides felis]